MFALVNDLVDEVSTSNEGGEADKVLPGKAAGLDPWEELMPPPTNSESQIISFYSNLLYQTFLPALSMLLTRKHLNAVEYGECQNHPRFFKVANDTEDQSITQSLRVMVHRRSTPRPDVLVSLETFEETRCAALFNERLSDEKNVNPDKVAFTLDAVVPGLQHLALGETKAPNTDEGKALLGTMLPGSGAWNVLERKCSCLTDLMVPETHHNVEGKQSWEYNKIGQSRDIKREQLLWEALGTTRPTPATDVVGPQLGAHNKDSFFDLCNQMWVGMVAYGLVIGWCATWYTGTRLVVRSPSNQTLFVSDILDIPLLDNDNRQQAAESRIRSNSPPYDRDLGAQHNNKTAIKAMVAASLAGLRVRMAEVGKPDEGWLEVTDCDEGERQNRVLTRLQDELLRSEGGDGGGDGGGSGSGGGREARGSKRKGSNSQTGRNVRGRTKATGQYLTKVLEDALTTSGYGIEQLHVRFHVGLLGSCRVDVFVPAEFEDVTSSTIPSFICSNTGKDSDTGKLMSSGRSQVPPPVPATTTLPTPPPPSGRCARIALVVTGLLGEGHRSDVLKVEASLLQADEDGGEVPTAIMAFKVSCGPDGLAALQSEYRTYKYLASQKGHQLNIPKAYGVFRFDMEKGGGGVVGGLLLSCEPGVPAWQLSAEKLCELRPQVRGAVNELHERGVVHGDLAMHNILVDEGGRICLVDFELAAHTHDPSLQERDLFRLNNMWGGNRQ